MSRRIPFTLGGFLASALISLPSASANGDLASAVQQYTSTLRRVTSQVDVAIRNRILETNSRWATANGFAKDSPPRRDLRELSNSFLATTSTDPARPHHQTLIRELEIQSETLVTACLDVSTPVPCIEAFNHRLKAEFELRASDQALLEDLAPSYQTCVVDPFDALYQKKPTPAFTPGTSLLSDSDRAELYLDRAQYRSAGQWLILQLFTQQSMKVQHLGEALVSQIYSLHSVKGDSKVVALKSSVRQLDSEIKLQIWMMPTVLLWPKNTPNDSARVTSAVDAANTRLSKLLSNLSRSFEARETLLRATHDETAALLAQSSLSRDLQSRLSELSETLQATPEPTYIVPPSTDLSWRTNGMPAVSAAAGFLLDRNSFR